MLTCRGLKIRAGRPIHEMRTSHIFDGKGLDSHAECEWTQDCESVAKQSVAYTQVYTMVSGGHNSREIRKKEKKAYENKETTF